VRTGSLRRRSALAEPRPSLHGTAHRQCSACSWAPGRLARPGSTGCHRRERRWHGHGSLNLSSASLRLPAW